MLTFYIESELISSQFMIWMRDKIQIIEIWPFLIICRYFSVGSELYLLVSICADVFCCRDILIRASCQICLFSRRCWWHQTLPVLAVSDYCYSKMWWVMLLVILVLITVLWTPIRVMATRHVTIPNMLHQPYHSHYLGWVPQKLKSHGNWYLENKNCIFWWLLYNA